MTDALELSQALAPELSRWRQELHRHPEIAWEEVRATKLAADWCAACGLEVHRLPGRTGLMGVLNASRPGPALGFRADMDALPVGEGHRSPHRSAIEGKAHLCGHDAHTAMLMGAVKVLSDLREELPFPVRFYFQPAEETLPGGAQAFVAAGFLEGVREVFALHISPHLPTGALGIRAGPAMASMARFEIHVEGRGGHGAIPHLSRDPVVAAAEIVLALQTVVSRRVDPLDPAVVSVCEVRAGRAFNVIPDSCLLVGTARTLSPGTRERMPHWIRELAEGVARAHDLTANVTYETGTPVLVNDADSVERMRRAFQRIGGRDREIPATMGGEDFARYLEKTAGCLGFLGAALPNATEPALLHHPRFDMDEAAMPWGVALFARLALDWAGS